MAQTLFISDLHLSAETPELNQLFYGCLKQWQGKIDALYILGDFFDAWVGDDDDSAFAAEVKAALRAFTEHTPVFMQHGNRDFLLGKIFAAETGVTLLPERCLKTFYGKPYLLLHGDELCTDDLPYQQFRMQSRNPMWQSVVLMKPLVERRMLAGQIRMMSETKKNADGLTAISDATESGIQAALKQAAAGIGTVPTLIHGHTHRPNIHEHTVDGTAVKRYVLQDWEGEQGGYLSLDDCSGITVHRLPE